ncbi:MAG: hypothetical protein JOZ41_18955 [Chloroflexi bacterium]|nr:hypothetical protein [Chloroflexota bacterium]
MKSLAILALGILSLSVAPATLARSSRPSGRHTSAARPTAPLPSGGTAVVIRPQGADTLIALRVRSGQLVSLTLDAAWHVATRDGRALSPARIRPGDQVVVRADRRMEDTSQRMADLKGIVAYALDPAEGALVVAVDRSLSIVADVDGHTRFKDLVEGQSSLETLEDADMVQLHGVFDDRLGEMTQTQTITRVGPVRCPAGKGTGACGRAG